MDYDLVVVGGGLAGSSLGIALARRGARVLIVEREAAFKDRVRGEGMLPWGVAEARTLGIHQPLIDGCSRDVRWWTTPQGRRDLHDTSPSGLGCLNFYHPEMQQLLLAIAVEELTKNIFESAAASARVGFGFGSLKHLRKIETIEVHVGMASASAAARRRAGGEPVVGIETHLVVHLPLLGITQDVIGFLDILEAVFGGFVSWIQIRMVLSGELPVSLADIVFRGGAGDAQGLVIIVFWR